MNSSRCFYPRQPDVTRHRPEVAGLTWTLQCSVEFVIISQKYLFSCDQIGVLNLQGRLSNQQSDCIFYFSRLVSIESYHIPYWAVIAGRN